MPLRVATKDDIPDLFEMLVELARFEKLDHEVHISREQFARDFEDGCFRGFIVIDDETERAAGMVLYHYTYDCWKGKTMSMDELIVRPEYRKKKYGKLLWTAVAQVAKERGVSHIMWDVLDWNKGAINFYHSAEGVSDVTKDNEGFLRYKMSREGIDQFVARNSGMRLQRGASWSQMLVEREAAIARGVQPHDRAFWYWPKLDRLSPTASAAFSLSYLDQDTQQFLDDSLATTESMCLQMWYSLASTLLSVVFTKTNINGLLGRGGMFLFSTDHARAFLDLPPEWTPKGHKMLDLGSGDGGVTRHLATLYDEVHVTEMSTMMQWRLRQRGYVVVDAHAWDQGPERYSLISALNLLDRHFSPRLLLSQLHKKALDSHCDVLLSLVLPIKPYVEFHPNGTSARPDQYLAVAGHSLEEQVSSLVDGEFRLSGFEVVKWTKLPYLCEGDLHKPYYRLDDVLFRLRPVAGGTVGNGGSSDGNYSNVVHNEL